MVILPQCTVGEILDSLELIVIPLKSIFEITQLLIMRKQITVIYNVDQMLSESNLNSFKFKICLRRRNDVILKIRNVMEIT